MDSKQFRDIIKEELDNALEPVKKVLGKHTKVLGEHTEKIDSIAAELHQVHQLADITLDVVKGRYEKNKREIDQIKDHLKLPKDPFFGDQP